MSRIGLMPALESTPLYVLAPRLFQMAWIQPSGILRMEMESLLSLQAQDWTIKFDYYFLALVKFVVYCPESLVPRLHPQAKA